MSKGSRGLEGTVGEWYLYKRICQIGFLSVRTGETAKTHALYPDTLMRIICSQRVQRQGWGHVIPQRDRDTLGASILSHGQVRSHINADSLSPNDSSSAHTVDGSLIIRKWVSHFPHKYPYTVETSLMKMTVDGVDFRPRKGVSMLTSTQVTWFKVLPRHYTYLKIALKLISPPPSFRYYHDKNWLD